MSSELQIGVKIVNLHTNKLVKILGLVAQLRLRGASKIGGLDGLC